MGEKRVVILGAGYAGLRAALDLDRLLGYGHKETILLINKHNYHQFTIQLHESAAREKLDYEDVRLPIADILHSHAVRFLKGEVTAIDRPARRVILGHVWEAYDYLIVALGGMPEFYNIPGLAEHALTLRSLNTSRMVRTHVESMFARYKNTVNPAGRKGLLTFIVGGAGLTGVELAGELAGWIPSLACRYDVDRGETAIMCIEAAGGILPGVDPALAEYARVLLEDKGVQFLTGQALAGVSDREVQLSSGQVIPACTVIWAGGIRGNPVIEAAGLTTQGHGRAEINEYLQSVDDPSIYVVGDAALARDPASGRPLAPNAQLAIREGRKAAWNIFSDLRGQPKKKFYPRQAGVLISLGPGQGIGVIRSFRAKGFPAALVKDMVTLKYLYSLGGIRLLAKKIL